MCGFSRFKDRAFFTEATMSVSALPRDTEEQHQSKVSMKLPGPATRDVNHAVK